MTEEIGFPQLLSVFLFHLTLTNNVKLPSCVILMLFVRYQQTSKLHTIFIAIFSMNRFLKYFIALNAKCRVV